MSKDLCRCSWVDLSKPDYVAYHDTEWGVPVYDDNKLFEFLTLEAAQAGLSWYTVLKNATITGPPLPILTHCRWRPLMMPKPLNYCKTRGLSVTA